MIRVIETNLSMKDKEIMDHQSRIIEVESWDEYIDYYLKFIDGYENDKEFKSITNLAGRTLPRIKYTSIYNFSYDEFHLSCNLFNSYYGTETKKLAYLIEYEERK